MVEPNSATIADNVFTRAQQFATVARFKQFWKIGS